MNFSLKFRTGILYEFWLLDIGVVYFKKSFDHFECFGCVQNRDKTIRQGKRVWEQFDLIITSPVPDVDQNPVPGQVGGLTIRHVKNTHSYKIHGPYLY